MEDDSKPGSGERKSSQPGDRATRYGLRPVNASIERMERLTGRIAHLHSLGNTITSAQPILVQLRPITEGRLGRALAAAASVGNLLGPASSAVAAAGLVARSLKATSAHNFGIGAAIAHSSALPIASILNGAHIGRALSASLRMAEILPLATHLPRSLVPEFRALQGTGILKALKDVEITVLEELINNAAEEVASSEDTVESNLVQEEQSVYQVPTVSAQDEAIAALQSKSGETKLTAQALAVILTAILMASALYERIGQWNDFRESVCDLNQRILTAPSLRHARDQVNSFLCAMPAEVSARMRLVNRDGVQLLDNPRRGSTKILPLPRSAVVEVLDSKGRNWIQVLYKHEGLEIVGWVSRSMVRTIPGR